MKKIEKQNNPKMVNLLYWNVNVKMFQFSTGLLHQDLKMVFLMVFFSHISCFFHKKTFFCPDDDFRLI